MSYPHEPQKEARWDKPPPTASPTPGTWEKQREATGGYRTRTGKPKNSHQVGAHAGLSRTTARSVRFLWSALNYGLSKLTSQAPHWDKTPHQGTLLQVESKLHDALDRLVCPQMQAKSQLQTFVLMTPPPICLGDHLALCCSEAIAILTYLDTVLQLNTCHSFRHAVAITLWLHASFQSISPSSALWIYKEVTSILLWQFQIFDNSYHRASKSVCLLGWASSVASKAPSWMWHPESLVQTPALGL